MYGMFGVNLNIENIYKLAAPHVGDAEIVTAQDLKPSYLQFLALAHKEFPISIEHDLVISEPERTNLFAGAFSESVLNDLHQERMVGEIYSNELLLQNIDLVKSSLKTLKKIRPDLADLFELAVHSIVLCNSNKNTEGSRAHGGTTNKCIGLIWLNLRPGISEHNILEMLIHELTHTLVFLDELNYEHFNYHNITKKEYWAVSSILKRQRPMDKVIHSIMVSMELIHARRTFLPVENEPQLLHPDTLALIKSIKTSIDSVITHPLLEGVCKPRAIDLVMKAKEQILEIEGALNA